MKPIVLRLTNRLKRTANFPAFPSTIEAVSTFYSEVELSPERLVKVISVDLGLCVQVLKAANSAYFNPLSLPMNTLSRAAVLLGFDNLKHIARAAPRLDPKVFKEEAFLKEYALALFTAHLAQAALSSRTEAQEEAYLAGLFRRMARLILIIYHPRIYHELLSLSEARKKELLFLVGERLGRHWNLPAATLLALEGREKERKPAGLLRQVILAEKLALSLLEEGVFYGWQRLFDSPRPLEAALKSLEEKLPYLPPLLREALSDWLNVDETAFVSEIPPEEEKFLYLPREALCLAQRALKCLCEELQVEGKVFYLEDQRLESPEGEISPEAERFLLEILKKGELFQGSGEEEFLYLPLSFHGQPALLLGFKRKEPFSEKEVFALKLLQKTLEGLLERL